MVLSLKSGLNTTPQGIESYSRVTGSVLVMAEVELSLRDLAGLGGPSLADVLDIPPLSVSCERFSFSGFTSWHSWFQLGAPRIQNPSSGGNDPAF